MELHHRLEEKTEVNIKKIYAVIAAPLCSKAEESLKAAGWRVFKVE